MLDSHPPLVTVIASCYNHAPYAAACLDSILALTYPHIQLIITDDCSTDGSAAAIRTWLQRHPAAAEFIPNDCNLGVPRTLNRALARARGQYVAVLADDDLWLPGFVLNRLQAFESGGE